VSLTFLDCDHAAIVGQLLSSRRRQNGFDLRRFWSILLARATLSTGYSPFVLVFGFTVFLYDRGSGMQQRLAENLPEERS